MGRRLLLLGFALALNACGPYPTDNSDERDNGASSSGQRTLTGRTDNDRVGSRKNQCDHNNKTGCMIGQIVVAPSVYLEGVEYFDMNTLGQSFPKLIQVKDKDGNQLAATDYDVAVDPGLTNETFLRDFALYLKGDRVEQAKIGSDGHFKLNYLEPGTYDIRVQKRFSVTVTPKAEKEGLSKKTYCMTLFSEVIGMEIDENDTTYKGFDDYKIQLMDLECKEKVKGSIVTL